MNAGGDDVFYRNSLARISLWIVVLGAAGTVLLVPFRGAAIAASFLLGSVASWLGFWRWRKIASALGGAPPPFQRLRWALRLGIIGAVLYVILRFLEISLVAALLGFLTAAAAVIVEIVYLLFSHRRL